MQMHKKNLPANITAVEKFASTSDLEGSLAGADRKGYFGAK